ncbi:MAG TPA: DUF5718 family protein [Campylobacterales bacterium]|nr:DUF5718 family protein [Campylobacterales bacterium]
MDFKNTVGIGVAGNFTGHLEQAGESADFVGVVTAEEDAPKGIFPFYLPSHPASHLATYPLSSHEIDMPNEHDNLQAEPEVAVVCDIVYAGDKVVELKPKFFGAYNDCSIRREGARKISDKKNWGANSKGIANKLLKVDSFQKGGVMDGYRIACYLRRGGILHAYGIDSALSSYSYFHGKLMDWIVECINNQQDGGPLENVGELLKECGHPTEAIVSIGATRYTEFGESGYLQKGDEIYAVLYPSELFDENEIKNMISDGSLDADGLSVLHQMVR